jgi:curved DNA-binding protein CbpA
VIRAAYRALAGLHHPDRNSAEGAGRLMAELNAAYEPVRSPDGRDRYDRMLAKAAASAAAPTVAPAPQPAGRSHRQSQGEQTAQVVDFGRYAGWSIADLARHDPDYLRWLKRHSSGIRYRQRIDAVLAKSTAPKASQRTR